MTDLYVCRIAMWSGINENPWCQLGEVLVVPLGGDDT